MILARESRTATSSFPDATKREASFEGTLGFSGIHRKPSDSKALVRPKPRSEGWPERCYRTGRMRKLGAPRASVWARLLVVTFTAVCAWLMYYEITTPAISAALLMGGGLGAAASLGAPYRPDSPEPGSPGRLCASASRRCGRERPTYGSAVRRSVRSNKRRRSC